MGCVPEAAPSALLKPSSETSDRESSASAASGSDGGLVLAVEDLHVEVDGHEILRGVDLAVAQGELHALMGPNGSGKSTLANALAGNPGYQVTKGRIVFRGDEVTAWPPDARARAGMFLAFQYPEEIPGVPVVAVPAPGRLRRVAAWRSRCSRSASPSPNGCSASTWTPPLRVAT